MLVADHLLHLEQTQEHIMGLFDYIAHSLKLSEHICNDKNDTITDTITDTVNKNDTITDTVNKNDTVNNTVNKNNTINIIDDSVDWISSEDTPDYRVCRIYTVLSRMGFINPQSCTKKIRNCRILCNACSKYKMIVHRVIFDVLDGAPDVCRPHVNNMWDCSMIDAIPYINYLNKYDPRCGRVPFARDLLTGLASRGLYRSCDSIRINDLGCKLHQCSVCFINERAGFAEFERSVVQLPREVVQLPREVVQLIRLYSRQKMTIGLGRSRKVCYMNPEKLQSCVIYNVCPMDLIPCRMLDKSACLKWTSVKQSICVGCCNFLR
jgi:hypothetical protein